MKYQLMFSKVSFFCGLLFVLGGCANNEPMPKIVHNPQPKPRIFRSSVVRPPAPKPARRVGNVPRDWLPPSQVERKWTAIVIHHSATENGNAAIFDKLHREENHWDGIGYDFLIGNGTDSGDGQVEVTFRWREQRTGAHCKTPGNWANEDAVGICLVGNFNHTRPTIRQMQSLLKLTRFLQQRYGISITRIYGHNRTPGAIVTDCPGRNSPLPRLKEMFGS
jgi:hypothetical protein